MDKAVLRPQRAAKSERRRARELSGQFSGRAKPHGREGAIGRRPSWPCKCQARGPGRHRLSGREHILAEMLHQSGNPRGNKQLMRFGADLKSVQAENCLVVCRITDKTFEGIPIIGVPL